MSFAYKNYLLSKLSFLLEELWDFKMYMLFVYRKRLEENQNKGFVFKLLDILPSKRELKQYIGVILFGRCFLLTLLSLHF